MLPSILFAESLVSTVDKTTIPANETFTLHVTYDADPADQELEITPLLQQFKIAARNKTSSIRIINGRASRETIWYFELSARKTGTLLIPSFSINNAFSEAIQITVTDAPKTVNNTNRNIYHEVVIDKQEIHVQEQLIVTWRLVSSLPISDPSMEQPVIDNVLVHDLGARHYQRSSPDGKIEVVLEQRYAFFPQQSGTLAIPAQQFQFLVNTQRRFQSGLLHNAQEKRRVRTETLSINVLPAPATANQKQWLPAVTIEMENEIQGLQQAGNAQVGEAFTRVITIRALGLMAEQLPSPLLDMPDFKVYNEKPELLNNSNEKGVAGIRTEKITMIPQHEGTLTLPAMEIHWFNTATRLWETASLSAKKIDVLPAKGKSTASLPPENSQPDMHDKTSAVSNNTASEATTATNHQWSYKRLGLISFFVIAISVLLARMIFLQRKLDGLLTTSRLPSNEKTIVTEKSRISRLTDTATANDVAGFYKAILDWAKTHWHSNPPQTIAEIAERMNNPELRDQLLALDACLYGSEQVSPSLTAMASALNHFHSHEMKPVIQKDSQLESLYRS